MNWIELKALNTLYKNKEVKLNQTLTSSQEISYLINSRRKVELGHKKLSVLPGYEEMYQRDYLHNFVIYETFLESSGLISPYLRFEESDIIILMGIQRDVENGNLEPLRQQILKSEVTVRMVSLMFFRNEKYLLGKYSLINSIKLLLGIKDLADDKDQQYKFVLECKDPRCIVLCENIDFLKRPTIARANHIELWYAGGKNIAKLAFADVQGRGLPIFYSCDWDYDGLCVIYKNVMKIIPEIKLLIPNGNPRGILQTKHDSKWGGVPEDMEQLLSPLQMHMLSDLVRRDEWIIEESNDLLEMLRVSS